MSSGVFRNNPNLVSVDTSLMLPPQDSATYGFANTTKLDHLVFGPQMNDFRNTTQLLINSGCRYVVLLCTSVVYANAKNVSLVWKGKWVVPDEIYEDYIADNSWSEVSSQIIKFSDFHTYFPDDVLPTG